MLTGNPMMTIWILSKANREPRIAHYAHVAQDAARDGWTVSEDRLTMSEYNRRYIKT